MQAGTRRNAARQAAGPDVFRLQTRLDDQCKRELARNKLAVLTDRSCACVRCKASRLARGDRETARRTAPPTAAAVRDQRREDDTHAGIGTVAGDQRVEPITPTAIAARAGDL